ncbi:MAG: deacylase [Rhodospirillaceae bacterium]|nr:deacylase [Rhodospirillaceae bacterium]
MDELGYAFEASDVLFGLADPLPNDGKTFGYVRVPYSSDLSAYGFIALPIAIIGHGDGPTALLMAGSQGDEYEGQIALARIARTLSPESMTGRVIIVPMANAPAAQAGRRNSPIDGFNLNRIYPGDVRGRPTAMIASYLERHVMSAADIVLDLHSGGRSLRFLPCATIIDHSDATERSRRLALALAFGAPAVLISHAFEERNSSGAARRAGAVRIGAEIGGGASAENALVDLTFDGVMNMLAWSGIVPESFAKQNQAPADAVYDVVQQRDYVYALHDGLFEPAVLLGDRVEEGDLAGLLHDPSRMLNDPVEGRFRASGRVVCLRVPALSERGDCLAHLAREAQERSPGELQQARSSQWLRDLYRRNRPRVRKPRPAQGEELR